MKTLQNGFTTPEQSKRLLELGVPADSADCMNFWNADIFQIPFQRPFSEHLELHVQDGLKKMYTPCWSVGRLMEIYDTCHTEADADSKWENHNALHNGQTYLDYVIYVFERNYMLGKFDFSKLEE